jgi:putative ABC transport system permease protein
VGEGIRLFVLSQFTQFGTNLIGVQPGKTQTMGISLASISTVRPLTLADAEALARLEAVEAVTPIVQGNVQISFGQRGRRTMLVGVGPDMPTVFRGEVAAGGFLPHDELRAARPFAVLGAKMARELFGNESPLGARIQIGGHRYTVLGVMAPRGQFLGMDLDDTAFIPAASALEVFNRESVMEIDVRYKVDRPLPEVTKAIERLLLARHGRVDTTLVTQNQMLEVMDKVLSVLTIAVGALGGISLVVGGIGIFTIMTIAVTERTPEIGLLRALGAEQRQILVLFLEEAVVLGALGGMTGIAAALLLVLGLSLGLPGLPLHASWPFLVAALVISLVTGLLAGLAPAVRAARLVPLDALRAE